MLPELPRYHAVTRRAFLQRSALVGGAALFAAPVLAACGGDGDSDADVFSESRPDSTAASASTTIPPADTTAGDTSVGDTTVADTAPTVVAGPELPASAQLEVQFTYTPSSSDGRIRNPYIAVWLETPDGDLVQTVSVWYQAREAKYLRELTQWFDAESAYLEAGGDDNVDMVSGATRTAGSYVVVWDGAAATGARALQGDYVLFVESAREHGPHHITQVDLTLGEAGVEATLPDDGELSALRAVYSV